MDGAAPFSLPSPEPQHDGRGVLALRGPVPALSGDGREGKELVAGLACSYNCRLRSTGSSRE
eukprot:8661276-Lingulodinium_polyedra.AAC.1